MFTKVIYGFVVQSYDDDGEFMGQDFVGNDDYQYEDEQGEPMDEVPNHEEVSIIL